MQKCFFLFMPVLFSAAAQLLIKQAALKEWKSMGWLLTMGSSVLCYILAFALYSVTVRYFPVSVASPVNTILVMLLVIAGGIFFWQEPFGMRRAIGAILGIIALVFMLSGE